jgi:Outer membrane efflux protein
MRAGFVTLRNQSVADAVLARRNRRGDGCAKLDRRVGDMDAALPAGKRLQRAASVNIFVLIMIAAFAYPTSAVTLREVLRTTLDNNPAILEAKAGLEQAAGQRLVFRSIVWPDFEVLVPAGVQYGHRAGESGVKGFAVGRGNLEQVLFNMAVPPSLRRGDIAVLIAQQQLNVAVVEQLHAVRLAFYAALYNRSLESIRDEQLQKLEENVATQKNRFEAGLADRSAVTSATIQADELVPQMEGARRAYREAQLNLAQAMGIDPAKSSLPEPEGELEFVPMRIDVAGETAAALQRRVDLKLARLFVRAANEDQRIIAADYYPRLVGRFRSAEFIGRNRQARHRISLGQKFVKKRHTPGVSLTTEKSGALC